MFLKVGVRTKSVTAMAYVFSIQVRSTVREGLIRDTHPCSSLLFSSTSKPFFVLPSSTPSPPLPKALSFFLDGERKIRNRHRQEPTMTSVFTFFQKGGGR